MFWNKKKAKKLGEGDSIANFLDPMEGMSAEDYFFGDDYNTRGIAYQKTGIIGKHISIEQYEKFRDPIDGQIYIVCAYFNGVKKCAMISKQKWEAAYKADLEL